MIFDKTDTIILSSILIMMFASFLEPMDTRHIDTVGARMGVYHAA